MLFHDHTDYTSRHSTRDSAAHPNRSTDARPAARRQNGELKMIASVKVWLGLKSDRRGTTALEYGIIACVLVAAVATAMTTLGRQLQNTFNAIGNSL